MVSSADAIADVKENIIMTSLLLDGVGIYELHRYFIIMVRTRYYQTEQH